MATSEAAASGKAGEAADEQGGSGSGVAKLVEIAEFFVFAIRDDATFRGTVQFRLKTVERPSGRYDLTVRVQPDGSVVWWEGDPPDGSVDVVLDMSLPYILKVYSGTASAAAVSKMVLSGRLYVHGFAYRALQRFASSFAYETPMWTAFYAERDRKAAEAAAAQARAAEAEAAERAAAAQALAEQLAEREPGYVKIQASGSATAGASVRALQQARARRALATMLGDNARQELDRLLSMTAAEVVAEAAASMRPVFSMHSGASARYPGGRRRRRSASTGELGPGLSVYLGDAPKGASNGLGQKLRRQLRRPSFLQPQASDADVPPLGPALSVFLGEPPPSRRAAHASGAATNTTTTDNAAAGRAGGASGTATSRVDNVGDGGGRDATDKPAAPPAVTAPSSTDTPRRPAVPELRRGSWASVLSQAVDEATMQAAQGEECITDVFTTGSRVRRALVGHKSPPVAPPPPPSAAAPPHMPLSLPPPRRRLPATAITSAQLPRRHAAAGAHRRSAHTALHPHHRPLSCVERVWNRSPLATFTPTWHENVRDLLSRWNDDRRR